MTTTKLTTDAVKALQNLLGLFETIDGGENEDAPEIAAARAVIASAKSDYMTEAKHSLKPCPFCGGEAKSCHIRDGRQIVCTACGGRGPSEFHGPVIMESAEERAVAGWNRRAHDADMLAALSALLPEIDAEIEQRQTSGNDEYWQGLKALSDAGHAAVAQAEGR